LVINFSLLEAIIYLPTSTTRDTQAGRVEVVSWPAAVSACFCSGTTIRDTALDGNYASTLRCS